MKKKVKNKKLISAEEISKKFKISYQTVNHYTNLNLLNVEKKYGNKRQYLEEKVKKRLQEIEKMKSKGYPLRLIGQILNGQR